MAKDYYKILGVEKNASEEDIKKAYRRLAHEHHPDKNGGDEKKFKDINEAYQVLGDKQKRATYDQFGSAAFEQGGAGGFHGFGGFDFSQGQGFPPGADFGDLGDILGEMFGFGGLGGRAKTQTRGKDIEMDLELSFKEAAFGLQKTFSIYKHSICSRCHGDGAEPGSKLESCGTCHGSGQVRQAQRSLFGTIQTVTACPTCHGRGKKPEKDCVQCRGLGVERKEQTMAVTIPGGMDDGEALRVTGEGEAAAYGGKPGDLFLRIHIKPDPRFERDGNDIHSEIQVSLTMLVLGGTISVETLDGTTELSIPEGTPADTVFTLRGKGIPYLRSHGRGNHLIRVIPDIPKHLTREQKRLIEELKREGL
ncbi:MAG TPA: molecular chaperone DnaJ [Patescibacteria group bacterium]|nr:molecular chaperone DnaJ [Patescibacteria group bacterium]